MGFCGSVTVVQSVTEVGCVSVDSLPGAEARGYEQSCCVAKLAEFDEQRHFRDELADWLLILLLPPSGLLLFIVLASASR